MIISYDLKWVPPVKYPLLSLPLNSSLIYSTTHSERERQLKEVSLKMIYFL